MALEKVKFLRSIGKFDNVSWSDISPLSKFSAIYADNARGKTTLSMILRSLVERESSYIMDRKKLASSESPKAVLEFSDIEAVFENEHWSTGGPDIYIFDDVFVAENVCSGTEIESKQRRNMHELIIGAEGVKFFNKSQSLKEQIETQRKVLNGRAEAIISKIDNAFEIEEFCKLKENPNIEDEINDAKMQLETAKGIDVIRLKPGFRLPVLSDFSLEEIQRVLNRNLESIEQDALKKMNSHLSNLGAGGEDWISKGVPLIEKSSNGTKSEVCPFCIQDLSGSAIISIYRSYFGDDYRKLKEEIINLRKNVKDVDHTDQVMIDFESCVREAFEFRAFWASHIKISEFDINAEEIKSVWLAARNAILEVLESKEQSPLEEITLPSDTVDLVTHFHDLRKSVVTFSEKLHNYNVEITNIKEKFSAQDVPVLEKKHSKLIATRIRFNSDTIEAINTYMAEAKKLKKLEEDRKIAQRNLQKHRESIFPKYRDSINRYLSEKFGADFKLYSVEPKNDRSGSTASYMFMVDNAQVPVSADVGASFRNTLSAGDRSSLSFAFFLASLDQDNDLSDKIVVIDDPISNLDKSRMDATSDVIMDLLGRAHQVIVLSHSKAFLHSLWKNAKKVVKKNVASAQINRGSSGSVFRDWDIETDNRTSHDSYHKMIRDYINSEETEPVEKSKIGLALRNLIEGYLRVACPEYFFSGQNLGQFIHICEEKENEILLKGDLDELVELVRFANKFHHESDEYESNFEVSDGTLLSYASRTLKFCSKARSITT